ncbi:MAG: hypothetical protein M8467_19160, partial [Anaerolineae bacterium]|nr:hypothetical protein [Anaerolineae bacterium]
GARRSQAGRSSEDLVGGVWMREYWDRYIRDERHFEAVVAYIHDNPVKAGLVKNAEDWPWSSARELAESAKLALGDPGQDGTGTAERQLGSLSASSATEQPSRVCRECQAGAWRPRSGWCWDR